MPERQRNSRPRSGASATSLLLTIIGELTAPHGGALWTSTALAALDLCDVNERNARQGLARLAEQGVLDAERRGRRTRWHITDAGKQLLTTGTERIYGFGDADAAWDEHWLVVLASVPEDQRAKRHQLKSRLEFAGLGFIGQGVAITPHVDREAEVNGVLVDLDLDDAVVFIARSGSLVPDRELIGRGWDLDALADRYLAFIHEFDARQPRSDSGRFVSLVDLVHEWRRFPFADPEIPAALLPARWPGHRAKRLFDARHESWSKGAAAWYLDTEAAGEIES
jgi:phenylacetic acid degradation operon negative regulatory protein